MSDPPSDPCKLDVRMGTVPSWKSHLTADDCARVQLDAGAYRISCDCSGIRSDAWVSIGGPTVNLHGSRWLLSTNPNSVVTIVIGQRSSERFVAIKPVLESTVRIERVPDAHR